MRRQIMSDNIRRQQLYFIKINCIVNNKIVETKKLHTRYLGLHLDKRLMRHRHIQAKRRATLILKIKQMHRRLTGRNVDAINI